MRLASLLARIQTMGFEGPFYRGIRGKLRFLLETVAWRREFVFMGTPESFAAAAAPEAAELDLKFLTTFDGVEKLRDQLESEYYPGFVDAWRRPFTWGEQLVLGSIAGRVAAFAWVQRGNVTGFPTYYGRLFEKDARILRVGVVPSFRRRGLNSRMMHSLLERLLKEGFLRIFAESHKYNVPSVRTFLKAGFHAAGLLTVVSVPGEGEFVRWSSPEHIASHLRELDIAAR